MLRAFIAVGLLLTGVMPAAANVRTDIAVCKASPTNPLAVVAACTRLLKNPAGKPYQDRFYSWRGTAYVSLGQEDKALDDLNSSVQLGTTDPYTYGERGMLWLGKGFLNKCIADETSAITRAQEPFADFYRFRAQCYSGNYEDKLAVEDARQMVSIQPDSLFFKSLYAEYLSDVGDSSLAKIYIEAAIAAEPDRFDMYGAGVGIALAAGDITLAQEYLDRAAAAGALRENPFNALGALASLALAKHNYDLALNEYSLAGKADPRRLDLLARLKFSTLLSAGRYDEVLKILAVPDNKIPKVFEQYAVGTMAAKAGRFDDAVQAFTQVVSISPNVLSYRIDRGLAYLQAGKKEEAKTEFNKVLARKPSYAAALYGLGRIAEANNDIQGARLQYAAAIEAPIYRDFSSIDEYRQDAEKRLASLRVTAPSYVPTTPNGAISSMSSEKPKEAANEVANLSPPPAKQEPAIAVVPKAVLPTDPIQLAAYQMLDTHCARCHQTDKSTGLDKAQTKVARILDLEADASNKDLVTPGLPLKSTLYFTVLRREMPYDVYQDGDIDKPMPTDAELDALRAWIVSLKPDAAVASSRTDSHHR